MKFKRIVILVMLFLALLTKLTFAQSQRDESTSKVGGLELPDVGYGVFGAAPHVNKDAAFTDYVPYYAKFALWVGGLDAKGQPVVTAGNGNSLTARPEWTADYNSFKKEENTGFANVEKVITTSYSDTPGFEGHTPLSLNVEQKMYAFVKKGFAVITFDISLNLKAAPLKEAYVGLWVDIDAAESDTKVAEGNDLFSLLDAGKAPIVFDGSRTGSSVPRLGVKILGTQTPIIAWWREKSYPETDAEQYNYLRGEAPFTDPNQPGDYRFLLSFGPVSLAPGGTFQFPVALVQASTAADFDASVKEAESFYDNELGGAGLKKSSASNSFQSTSTDFVPGAFQLRQNFPNPFNPETQIQFDLPQPARVELNIYNTLGQLVRKLIAADYPSGTFGVTWNGRDDAGRQLPSGIYIYRIKAGDFQAERKLLLLK